MDVRLFLCVVACSGMLLSTSCDSDNLGPSRPGTDTSDDDDDDDESPVAKKDAGKPRKDAGKGGKGDEEEEDEEDEEEDEEDEEEDDKETPKDAGPRKDASTGAKSDASSSTPVKDSGSGTQPSEDAGTPPPRNPPLCTQLTYQNFVQNFMQSHCIMCHGAGTANDFSTLEKIQPKAAVLAERVSRARTAPGTMPPSYADQPIESDRQDFIQWANCEAMAH